MPYRIARRAPAALLWLLAGPTPGFASGDEEFGRFAAPDNLCRVDDRPAVVAPVQPLRRGASAPDPADCALSTSNPSADYDPTFVLRIQVVVHIIQDSACSAGALTDAQVASQITVMNEDFRALAGTPGAGGVDSGIEFVLATIDPEGEPTTGITRDCNSAWYTDPSPCPYCAALAWDPTRYLNLYTNTAANARGYVPFLPATPGAGVGTNLDRVVINTLAFGRPGPVPAHAGGRTVTHEVGHFLGLFHVYFNGCGVATVPDCYATGDLLCDTLPDAADHHGCPLDTTQCGGVTAPVENYMELSDDSCLQRFTLEQARRMRCTLQHYRAGLAVSPGLFADGFETGSTTNWSATVP
jgi:hypothetical protein